MQPTQSWPELARRLTPGRPVAVTDGGGTEVRGTVSAVSAAALTLNVQGVSRRFDSTDVRQVRRDGDPLWNGLVIGAVIGVTGAALPDNRCGGRPVTCDDRQIPFRLTFLSVATAAGIGIDVFHRDRRILYGSARRVTLRVVPAHTRGGSLSMLIGFSGVHHEPHRTRHAEIPTASSRPASR